jgi:hypothetical protein
MSTTLGDVLEPNLREVFGEADPKRRTILRLPQKRSNQKEPPPARRWRCGR